MAVGSADELWLRLTWFSRLRWAVPPALVALGAAVNASMGPIVPLRATSALLALVWVLNSVYVFALGRWQATPDAHAQHLRTLAHAQVLGDIAIMSGALYLTGGGATPFWPFLCVTPLAAAMFFARTADVVAYGAAAVAAFAGVSLARGGVHGSLLLLAMLVGNCALIALYFARRTEELAKLREEARHKEQALSLVSHELGNPLAVFRAGVEMTRRHTEASADEAVARTLARMDAQVDRMARLVGDLYDLASLQRGTLRVEPRPCDVAAVVRDVVERFATLAPTLRLDVDAPPALWCRVDEQRIDQLLTNLLSNAARYAGPEAHVRVALAPASGGTVELTVRDDGPGIPADKLPAIFEPFRRLDASSPKGLGLGLALARQIAVLHGGVLSAESRLGAGAVFRLRLPTGDVSAPS